MNAANLGLGGALTQTASPYSPHSHASAQYFSNTYPIYSSNAVANTATILTSFPTAIPQPQHVVDAQRRDDDPIAWLHRRVREIEWHGERAA